MNSLTQVTSGAFATEKETELFFDSKINSDFFVIEKEVSGRRLFDDKCIKRDAKQQTVRIDRILHPTRLCYKKGWHYGAIGVELKASSMALGGIFAQVLEQRQSIFCSKFLNNTRIMPSFFAIFPLDKIKGDLHSLLHTQLILACSYQKRNNAIRFSNGNFNILEIGSDICVNENYQPSTKKGHRGLSR